MRITQSDIIAMEMRLAQNHRFGLAAQRETASDHQPVERESDLHKAIMEDCDHMQPWPWQYIRARMDKRSTIGNGVHDLTIFGPYPLCILVEAKARNEKQKDDQLLWAAKLSRLRWEVHVVRSIERWMEIKQEAMKP
jgi:hypothetical protein